MELNSGEDLITLKDSIEGYCSSSPENPPSTVDADHYARCNGLTIDSLLLQWPQLIDRDQAIASSLINIGPGQLIETVQLPECLFRVIIPTSEQWQMPASSLQILQQVCGRSREDEIMDLVSQQCFTETARWKHLKLDAPALRSDHDTDCRRLGRRVRAFRKEPLPDHRLPLHPVDVEKGEGLEFPRSLVQMDRKQMKAIGEESLEITRDTLVYLMQSLKAEVADDDRWDFIDSVSTYQGIADHLTPPLSPMAAASPEYFVPAADLCELPEPSDLSSRLSDDIEAAESKIFDTEYSFWADTLEQNVSPGRYDDVDVPEMIRSGEFRLPIPPSYPQPLPRGLKVDVPLLPCSDDNVNATETTRVLAPDDLAEAKELVVSSDTMSGSDGPTGQLVSFFVERAAIMMRYAEQEKLQPLDATARVAVPVLGFSIPVPEWEQRLWEAKAMFRWIQKDVDVDWHGPKWTHNRAAEHRMVWTPLAHMRERELVSEHIHVDSELVNSFLTICHAGEVLSSADYVYKPPGPAIFRPEDDEDDEEDILEPLDSLRQAPPYQRQDDSWGKMSPWTEGILQSSSSLRNWVTPPLSDLTTLLTRKKRLIDEMLQREETGEEQDRTSSSPDIINSALIPSTNVLRGFMSEYTDFAPLVDNFVDINFPKKPKLTHSSFFAPPSPSPSSSQTAKAEEAAKLMPPPPKPVPALAPTITPPAVPPRIIVSSTTSTPITQHLQTLLPNIELIHRDPSKHRPPTWFPGQASPNLDEADIVVSPATGILLTTMIKLRQKALPPRVPQPATATPTTGPSSNKNSNNNATTTTTTTTFSHIVANVSARHERLVVLVSEGNRHSETATPLSRSDARALAEFQGFAAGLSATTTTTTAAAAATTRAGGEMRVVYVGGGTETLAKWVAAVVCDYAAEAEAVRGLVLPVETLWEVFLRRAGMNAFAAQVVLGRLRVPDGVPAVGGGDESVFGLPLFVVMGRERRAELFGEVFGGRRVLDRVSEVLDEPWAPQDVNDETGLGYEIGPGWGRFQGENAQLLERW